MVSEISSVPAPEDERIVRLLIAALGGEGGSVLTSWIVAAATAEGWPVQSSSVPGVAQRTGATTYYVELMPKPRAALAGREPIFALTPTPGFVDLVVATELLEAGRAIENGYVAPERTTLIASSHRVYTIHEKIHMADGRFDGTRVTKAIDQFAKRSIVLDLDAIARRTGSIMSSIVLGVIAASGVLPISRERFEAVIRAGGVAVEANLRGFAGGFEAVAGGAPAPGPSEVVTLAGPSTPNVSLPVEVAGIAEHAATRLEGYQNRAYAQLYRRRLEKILDVDRAAGGQAKGWPLAREVGRHLALWMSYEDVIRVADLKTSAERWRRLHDAREMAGKDVLRVTDFLKPGVEEIASILPPAIGRRLLAAVERRGKIDDYNVGLHLRTSSVTGFLLLRCMARLRWWRPRSYRFQEEDRAIEGWVERIAEAAALDYDFAVEIAKCAQLRKGYGSTHRRGSANFTALMASVVAPALQTRRPDAARLAALRARALSDPERTDLAALLAAEAAGPHGNAVASA